MNVICFEDAGVARLAPATTSRPTFGISCGGYRLCDWVTEIARERGGRCYAAVRPLVREICRLDYAMTPIDALKCDQVDGDVLMVNARIAPTMDARRKLMRLADLSGKSSGTQIQKTSDGESIVTARFDAADWQAFVAAAAKSQSIVGTLMDMADAEPGQHDAEPAVHDLPLFHWPHDLVRLHMSSMGDALDHRINHGDWKEIQENVFVGEDVTIGDHCVFDTSDGPVVLDHGVSIGPMSFFAGPVYAAPKVRIIEHSAIKDAVTIGHTCKVGGEVEASVLEPYTNKQHHGFLGHSYLGSWINLGAGTCNSDLKNTYGKINATYGTQKVATDMQFFGCVIGDYSKTAINTSIFTGKVIGVCSMMYGFVTSNVPSYVNYARLFGQTSLLPADVMVQTQQRMFSRRKVEQRPCDEQLIRDMYAETSEERAADADLL